MVVALVRFIVASELFLGLMVLLEVGQAEVLRCRVGTQWMHESLQLLLRRAHCIVLGLFSMDRRIVASVRVLVVQRLLAFLMQIGVLALILLE